MPRRMVVSKWILSTGTANALAGASSVKSMTVLVRFDFEYFEYFELEN